MPRADFVGSWFYTAFTYTYKSEPSPARLIYCSFKIPISNPLLTPRLECFPIYLNPSHSSRPSLCSMCSIKAVQAQRNAPLMNLMHLLSELQNLVVSSRKSSPNIFTKTSKDNIEENASPLKTTALKEQFIYTQSLPILNYGHR